MISNVLGDLRAEHDHDMLNAAFYETPDFKSIIEFHGKSVIVGRRGTGKSATFYQLSKFWSSDAKARLVTIAPEESEVIGMRHVLTFFGSEENLIRAGCKVAWRYALLLEVADQLCRHYKLGPSPNASFLDIATRQWRKGGQTVVMRLCTALSQSIILSDPVEKRIGALAGTLCLSRVQEAVNEALDATKLRVQILVDKLDEGYEPDVRGIALLTGLAYAANFINTLNAGLRCILFFRDNVFRAIERHDPDYSRDLEGQVLRLHWDEYNLLNMIVNRLRVAFTIHQESGQKVWDLCTDRAIQGKDGFRHCLRLTLYRPRDLLVLLNEAFHKASQHDRKRIIDEDIDQSAREMSEVRLRDLLKEYAELVPGLEQLLNAFSHGTPELPFADACSLLDGVMSNRALPNKVLQHMEILGSAEAAVRTLYSVGFLGVKQPGASAFTFCHDGKRPVIELTDKTAVLVHPCYWIAQNLIDTALPDEEVQDIHDDYEIEVTSETPEIRKRHIGQFIGDLQDIPADAAHAHDFEEWALRAVRMLFPKSLANIQLHPNKDATQRRDIVARNDRQSPAWQRVYDDYGSRQVIFEVKNFSTPLGPKEYRQMLSYLTGEHGRLGFIINRSDTADLTKGSELDWVREMYQQHDCLIIKLPARELVSWISKLRNPQKHDAPDRSINGLIDRYARMYVQIGYSGSSKRKKHQKQR